MSDIKILNKNNTSEAIYSQYRVRSVARALIIKERKLLLIHSQKYKSYTLPGGGVEEGESLEQAAIREAREETGIGIKIIKEVGKVAEIFDERGILNVTTAFSAQVEDEQNQIPDPDSVEEGQELVWIELSKVRELLDNITREDQRTSMLRDSFFIGEYLQYTSLEMNMGN